MPAEPRAPIPQERIGTSQTPVPTFQAARLLAEGTTRVGDELQKAGVTLANAGIKMMAVKDDAIVDSAYYSTVQAWDETYRKMFGPEGNASSAINDDAEQKFTTAMDRTFAHLTKGMDLKQATKVRNKLYPRYQEQVMKFRNFRDKMILQQDEASLSMALDDITQAASDLGEPWPFLRSKYNIALDKAQRSLDRTAITPEQFNSWKGNFRRAVEGRLEVMAYEVPATLKEFDGAPDTKEARDWLKSVIGNVRWAAFQEKADTNLRAKETQVYTAWQHKRTREEVERKQLEDEALTTLATMVSEPEPDWSGIERELFRFRALRIVDDVSFRTWTDFVNRLQNERVEGAIQEDPAIMANVVRNAETISTAKIIQYVQDGKIKMSTAKEVIRHKRSLAENFRDESWRLTYQGLHREGSNAFGFPPGFEVTRDARGLAYAQFVREFNAVSQTTRDPAVLMQVGREAIERNMRQVKVAATAKLTPIEERLKPWNGDRATYEAWAKANPTDPRARGALATDIRRLFEEAGQLRKDAEIEAEERRKRLEKAGIKGNQGGRQ